MTTLLIVALIYLYIIGIIMAVLLYNEYDFNITKIDISYVVVYIVFVLFWPFIIPTLFFDVFFRKLPKK